MSTARVIAEVERLTKVANEKIRGHVFIVPYVKFSHLGRCAGKAWLQTNTIEFNIDLVEAMPERIVSDTVPHEMAHLIHFALRPQDFRKGSRLGHGRYWQMLARLHLAGRDFAHHQPNLRSLPWWKETVPTILPFLEGAQRELLSSELAHQEAFFASADYAALPEGPCHADLFRETRARLRRSGGAVDRRWHRRNLVRFRQRRVRDERVGTRSSNRGQGEDDRGWQRAFRPGTRTGSGFDRARHGNPFPALRDGGR